MPRYKWSPSRPRPFPNTFTGVIHLDPTPDTPTSVSSSAAGKLHWWDAVAQTITLTVVIGTEQFVHHCMSPGFFFSWVQRLRLVTGRGQRQELASLPGGNLILFQFPECLFWGARV